jgi:hypothetical protein
MRGGNYHSQFASIALLTYDVMLSSRVKLCGFQIAYWSFNYRHAKFLHESLLEIFNRIDAVKQEHDKLDSNNKFLQKYIGDLMSTSKITATGASGRKK